MKNDKYYKEILFHIKLCQYEPDGTELKSVYCSVLNDIEMYLQKYIGRTLYRKDFVVSSINSSPYGISVHYHRGIPGSLIAYNTFRDVVLDEVE